MDVVPSVSALTAQTPTATYIRSSRPRTRTYRKSTPAQSAIPAYRWPTGPVTIHAASTSNQGRRRRMT